MDDAPRHITIEDLKKAKRIMDEASTPRERKMITETTFLPENGEESDG